MVETHADEVEIHQLDDGPHTRHRRADTEADDRALGDRRVANAIAETVVQAARQAEDVAPGRDVDARDEHALVRVQLHFERGSDRIHRAEHRGICGRARRFGPLGSRPHDEVRQRRDRRTRELPRGGDRGVELVRDRRLHGFERGVGDARRLQPARVDEQRIARFPLPHLVGRPVALRVAFVVTVPPVRGRLDDDGAASRARRVDDALHRGRGRNHVVAVDRDEVDAVTGSPALERRRVLRRGGRELGVAVVLAEEDHRQLPDRGEVDRLVERTVRHRAVAEERDHDTAVASQLRGGRGTGRDRQARADDSVGAEDPECRIGDVHRTAAPAVRALVLGHQLGEHPERVETLGEAVTMAAMGGRDHVGRAERPAGAHGRRLLPDRQVHEARHLAVAVERGHTLLESADHEHPPVHLEELGVSEHEAVIVTVGTNGGERRWQSRSTSPRRSPVPRTWPGNEW